MNANARDNGGSKLLGVRAAAKYLGISVKTFRDRIMPHTPTLIVSAPSAERQRRLFSVEAIDETVRRLQRAAA